MSLSVSILLLINSVQHSMDSNIVNAVQYHQLRLILTLHKRDVQLLRVNPSSSTVANCGKQPYYEATM